MDDILQYIFSFIAQKGGVGKSTLARAIALELVRNKYRVLLADVDPQQGTIIDWNQRRINNGMSPVCPIESYRSSKDAIDAAKAQNTFEALVIDAAGRASEGSTTIAKRSTIVIQPSGASEDDLVPAIRLFHELTAKGIEKEKLFIALCHIGTDAEEDAAREYFQHAGYSVLDGAIYERPAYRLALNKGKSITETGWRILRKKPDILIQSIFNEAEKLKNTEQATKIKVDYYGDS